MTVGASIRPRVCALTMVYNEKFNLPRWVTYYGGQIGKENLLVIDNDSTDESRDLIRSVPNLRYPRTGFCDIERSKFVSALASSLLLIYDYVIYTDSDEIIIPDPERYTGIIDFLSKNPSDAHTCIGFNVFERIGHDRPYDPGLPLLLQRKNAHFLISMCKTSIVAKPPSWSGGFHASNLEPNFSGLLLLHLKSAIIGYAKERLQITRTLEWRTQTRAGAHQRISDEAFDEIMTTRAKHDPTPLTQEVIQELAQRLRAGVKPIKRAQGDTLYQLEPPSGRWFVRLPEAYHQLI